MARLDMEFPVMLLAGFLLGINLINVGGIPDNATG